MDELEKHKRAFELFCKGYGKRRIAQELGVSVGTITYWSSSSCRCTCGYHDWSEKCSLAQLEDTGEKDARDLPAELDSAESVVVSADLIAVHGLLVLVVVTLVSQFESVEIKPRTLGDLLDSLKLIERFKDLFSADQKSPELKFTKQTGFKLKDFSPAELDRFADLFLKRHVVEGGVPSSTDFEGKKVVDVNEVEDLDSMLNELTGSSDDGS